jgi:hypothetical protein
MLEGSGSVADLSLPPTRPPSPPRAPHTRCPALTAPPLGPRWAPPLHSGAVRHSSSGGARAAAATTGAVGRLPWGSGWWWGLAPQRQQPAAALGLKAALPRPAWLEAGGAAEEGRLGATASTEAVPAPAELASPAELAARQLSSESIAPRPECQAAASWAAVGAEARGAAAARSSLASLAGEGSCAGWGAPLSDPHSRSALSLSSWQAAAAPLSAEQQVGCPREGHTPDLHQGSGSGSGAASGAHSAGRAVPPTADPCDERATSFSSQAQQAAAPPRLSLGSAAASPCLPSAADSPAVTPRQHSVRSAGRCVSGLLRVEELRGEAAAEGHPASADRLSLASHAESFNSEEGFGSPVKQRRERWWHPVAWPCRLPAGPAGISQQGGFPARSTPPHPAAPPAVQRAGFRTCSCWRSWRCRGRML